MKKAVFFDIDGTLWDYHMQIPDSTVLGIRKLREQGNLAFICSGRSRATICTPALLEIGFDGIVAGCGTHIERQGEILFEKIIPQEEVSELLRILTEYRMHVIVEGKEYLYAKSREFAGDRFVDYLKCLLGERFLEWTGETAFSGINKMSADLKDVEEDAIEEMKKRLSPDYEIIFHGMNVIEILPKGYSKALGIQKVCEFFGIDRRNTYAFGDGSNDMEMIKFAAYGIAMGNGSEEIKEAADYVTDSVKNDGVWKGLKHYYLI